MSNLTLNEKTLPFKEFYGRNYEQMPRLIEEGRIPLSVAGLMQKRLDVLQSGSEEVQGAWWNNYFDTGDGIFYHPDGNIKVVLGAKTIRAMTDDSQLSNGALVLGNNRDSSIEAYAALEGSEFKRTDLKLGEFLSRDEAKNHPVWRALVPNADLLNEYVDVVFSKGKGRFGYDRMMGVWANSAQDVATGRLWCVYDLNLYSIANDDVNIESNNGRLVGVVPEALGAQNIALPNPKNIADAVQTYLSTRTVAQGITKKGLLEVVQGCYK